MSGSFKPMLTVLLMASCGLTSLTARAQVAASAAPANGGMKPVVLDRVVAIINGDVLLESDVQEELHFATLESVGVPGGTDSLRRAARRLISRTLILQQMKQQQQPGGEVSDSDAEKDLAEARKHLARCKPYDCATDAGWKAFLAANDMTEQDVLDHWKQRMEILRFIDIRFRTGIRISKQEIADYYQQSIVPGYAHDKGKPPSLETLTPRIREVMLQQHVNGLMQDWMKSLRDEGSVQILDPAYGQSSGEQGDEDE
jgi:peptidyl-prolyl cis-trans isomerase SurA